MFSCLIKAVDWLGYLADKLHPSRMRVVYIVINYSTYFNAFLSDILLFSVYLLSYTRGMRFEEEFFCLYEVMTHLYTSIACCRAPLQFFSALQGSTGAAGPRLFTIHLIDANRGNSPCLVRLYLYFIERFILFLYF